MRALSSAGEHRDVGVAAQAEDMLDAAVFEILRPADRKRGLS